jgi:hypothetical protein
MQPTLHYDSYWSGRGSGTRDPITFRYVISPIRMFEQQAHKEYSTRLYRVAALVSFLASKESHLITGQSVDLSANKSNMQISIDGGRYFD